MKRALKISLWIGSFLGAVCIGFLISVWFFPSIVLNDRTLLFAKRLLEKEGIHLQWEKGSLTGTSLSFFEKEATLQLEKLCVSIEQEGISGCFKRLLISVHGGYLAGQIGIHRVGPVEVEGDWARYVQNLETNDPKVENKEEAPFTLPSWLVSAYPNQVHILLPKIEVITPGFSPVGFLELQADGRKDWTGQLRLNAKANKQIIELDANGKGNPSHAEVTLKARTEGLLDLFPEIRSPHCQFNWNKDEKNENLNLNCPLQAKVALNSVADIPLSTLTKRLSTDVKAEFLKPKGKESVEGKISISASPLFSAIKEGEAAIEVETQGNISDLKSWSYKHITSISIERFSKIRNFFEDTTWAIPQPFNALDGKVHLQTKGEGTFENFQVPAPLTLTTELTSQNQVLRMEVQSSYKDNHLALAAELKEIKLVLPSLDITSVPPLLPDTRIHRVDPGRELVSAHPAPNPFTYEFSFKTSEAKRLELVSHLGKEPIPLTLNLKANEEDPLHGLIQVKSFPLNLFRRNAKVDFIHLNLAKVPEMSTIDGQVRVFYTDYTITLLLDGLLDSPQVHVFSTPPLPEKQVIAVLLFGRSLDFLESDQMESVGNARAALADGAIGLASLYALASTPIESVGYNGITKSFTAKLRLADGTSMNIGTNLKQVNTLGLRRRLGPNWSINTYFENPFLAAERSLTSFLEWHWRY